MVCVYCISKVWRPVAKSLWDKNTNCTWVAHADRKVQIVNTGPILHEGNEGDCLHDPWSLPWCPWNAPVEIYNFLIRPLLPGGNAFVTLPLQKRSKCTGLRVQPPEEGRPGKTTTQRPVVAPGLGLGVPSKSSPETLGSPNMAYPCKCISKDTVSWQGFEPTL